MIFKNKNSDTISQKSVNNQICIIILLICCLASCRFGAKKVWKPVIEKHSAYVHIVKYRNETLKKIAKWYTGSQANWKSILYANPAISPEEIAIGTHVFIPRKFLIKKVPMPENFQVKRKKILKKNKEIIPIKKESKTLEDFELYGPR